MDHSQLSFVPSNIDNFPLFTLERVLASQRRCGAFSLSHLGALLPIIHSVHHSAAVAAAVVVVAAAAVVAAVAAAAVVVVAAVAVMPTHLHLHHHKHPAALLQHSAI